MTPQPSLNQKPDLPSNVPRGPDRPGVPLRGTSQNYINALSASSSASPTSPNTVKIPDGRKTATGEEVPSPTETWKPDFKRKQSYNKEDLKHEIQMSGMSGGKEKCELVEKEQKGFSELSGSGAN